jgi:hypothetical protein
VHKEDSLNQLERIQLYWPSIDSDDDRNTDVRNSIFVVPQSEIYRDVKQFYSENVLPLKLLMTKPDESVASYTPETKTRLLWCAESIVRETGNKFFMGKIHNYIKEVSNRAGKFCMHRSLKVRIPATDERDLNLAWGIRPQVVSSAFKSKSMSDNKIADAQLVKSAIRNHKGKIDFPTIFVESRMKFWVTTQRFSMNKNKHHDIGFFEQPDWRNLASMNTSKMELYSQTMMKILV